MSVITVNEKIFVFCMTSTEVENLVLLSRNCFRQIHLTFESINVNS